MDKSWLRENSHFLGSGCGPMNGVVMKAVLDCLQVELKNQKP